MTCNMNEGLKRFVPIKERREARKRKLPLEIRKQINIRNKLWRRYKLTVRNEDWVNYKQRRNEVKSRIREWESELERERIAEFKGNERKFYGYVRNKQKVKSRIDFIKKSNDELTSSELETAERLNEFFKSVFVEEGDFAEDEVREVERTINLVEIQNEDVMKKINNLKENKAQGPDQMSPKVIKECKEKLCPAFTILFNKSMEEEKLPKIWKAANVTPIFKGGDKTEAGNYRPVSLTSVPCKMMESIVVDKVKEHLKSIGVPRDIQHGFVSGRSCLTNLLTSLESWTKEVDEGYPVDVIYLDIAKAFDSVPHQRLKLKMKRYGLEGKVLGWLSDFLTERKMRVCVNGNESSWCSVTSSVPQGSVGGPMQFSLFLDDMADEIVNRIIQFADDTKLWRRMRNELDRESLQKDLEALSSWSERWKLKFNPKKCKVLHIGRGNEKFEYTMREKGETVILGETTIEKDLGVMISNDLKVSEQCNKAAKKAMRILGMIKRSFKNLDEVSLKTLYCSFVRPHLEYCIQAWSPYLVKDITVLEKVQRRATKLVARLKNLPYEERLTRLNIYPLEQRRLRGDLIETYKILTGKEDVDASEFFQRAIKTDLRGHEWKLFRQRSRLNVRKHFFTQRVVNFWNALPSDVVKANSTNTFKNRIDKHWRGKKWTDIKAQGLYLP
jgi:ribonuclease P/MRP protein subunit RPP40